MQHYFQVTPPTVHTMVKTLERKQLISRQPHRARTIEVLVPLDQIPSLD